MNKTSLGYDMDLIIMMVRVAPIYHGYPIRNGPANSIPILNENRPIHLIHLSLKKDPFPSILYSHILVRNGRAASLGPEQRGKRGVIRVHLLSPRTERKTRCYLFEKSKASDFIGSNSAFYTISQYIHESDWLLVIT